MLDVVTTRKKTKRKPRNRQRDIVVDTPRRHNLPSVYELTCDDIIQKSRMEVEADRSLTYLGDLRSKYLSYVHLLDATEEQDICFKSKNYKMQPNVIS